MRSGLWQGSMALVVVGAMTLTVGGCNQAEHKESPPQVAAGSTAEKPKHHDHSSWWCDEHGVPEEICGQCNARYAAECKKKGDWCNEHDRPKSQCFKCDPSLREKFAALYRTRYGKEPPPIEDDESPQKDEKQ